MKIAILVSLVAMQAAVPVAAPAPDPAAEHPRLTTMPNVLDQRPGCVPIARQVQEDAARERGGDLRTLDREPAAHMLLAVDRKIDGCREPTIVRRDVAPRLRR